jgi:DNA polymerase III alpha subunit
MQKSKVISVKSLGIQKTYNLTMRSEQHNYAVFGENKGKYVISRNSHAYAYAYLSMKLLCMKAHFPIEFYTAILMCENDADKIKVYKHDAMKHVVEVCPVHINNSRTNFNIHEEKIFFGFSNVNHVGEGMAQRIESHQPYQNYMDFLNRFGTDAHALKALTALGVFEEKYDRLTMRKYSEFFKNKIGSRKDAKKRFDEKMKERTDELTRLLKEEVDETHPDFEKLNSFSNESVALWDKRFEGITREVPYKYKGEERVRVVLFSKLLQDLAKKRQKSIEDYEFKSTKAVESPVTIDQFDPESIYLDPKEVELLTDELVLNGKTSYPKAERHYYGFQWIHRLETCPGYQGKTLDNFLHEAENEGVTCDSVEVEIMDVVFRESKKGVVFYTVLIEDSNGKQMKVNIWNDDYTRFEEYLKVGNLVKMRVKPPGGGFDTLTFESVPRHKRRYLPPKEDDARMILMIPPEPVKVVEKKQEVSEAELDEMVFDPAFVIQPSEFLDAPKPAKPDVVIMPNDEFERILKEMK